MKVKSNWWLEKLKKWKEEFHKPSKQQTKWLKKKWIIKKNSISQYKFVSNW
jgi:hypothetical protein